MKKSYNLKKQTLLFLLLLITGLSSGQTGWSIDQSFNKRVAKTDDFFFLISKQDNGKFLFVRDKERTKLNQMNANGTINQTFSLETTGNIIALTPAQGNKTYVGGNFTNMMNVFAPKIARINLDGTRDLNFLPDSNTQDVYALQEQSDGKLLVGRNSSIERLNADGSIDTTFTTLTTNGIVYSFAILPNGKILVGGVFTTINGTTKNRIVLLNSNGTIDTSFVSGTAFNNDVYIVRVASDGSFYIGGKFTTYKGNTVNRIAKISNIGTLDTTFHNSNNGFDDDVWTIEFLTDNKPLIGGAFKSYKNINNNSIIKLNLDGTIDTTFDTGIAQSNGIVYNIIINSSSNFIISGTFIKYREIYTNQAFLANNDGSINTSFHLDERFCIPGITHWNQKPTHYSYMFRYPTAIQTDGKIVLGNVYFENKFYVLIRLNADGTRDTSFNFNISDFPIGYKVWDITKILIRPNGKIICSALTGRTQFYDGASPLKGLFQLNIDGSLDNSFNTGFIYSGSTDPNELAVGRHLYIALQSDGKLIVYCNATFNYRGFQANSGAIRVLENGNVDISFQNISGSFPVQYGVPIEILPLPNNQIIIYAIDYAQTGYGDSIQNPNNFNNIRLYSIIKLNSNGTLANRFENLSVWNYIPTWNSTAAAALINKIYLDGNSLIIAGKFNRVNGNIQNSIARIDFDGNFINDFNSPIIDNLSHANTQVTDITKHNNKYYYSTISNLTPSNLAIYDPLIDCDINILRANSDGSLDTTFSMVTLDRSNHVFNTNAYSPNYPTSSRSPRNVYFDFNDTNKLVIFGSYDSINSQPYIGLSRIIINPNLSTNDNQFSENSISIYPNPTNSFVNIESSDENINQINVYDLFGRLLKSKKAFNNIEKIDIQELPNAVYLVEIKTDKGSKSVKIVKY